MSKLETIQPHLDNSIKELERDTRFSVLSSLLIVATGIFLEYHPMGNYVQWALATPVIFFFGRSFFINSFKLAQSGHPNVDTLVALSAGTAYLFSVFNTLNPLFLKNYSLEPYVYFELASVLIAFILLGRLLKQTAKVSSPERPVSDGFLLIKNGNTSPPNTLQSFEDNAAGAFFPVTIGIAIVSMFTWAVLGSDNRLLQEMLSILMIFIISCPCALTLATAVPLLVAVNRGIKSNLLFENIESMHATQQINTFILDKTGVLTEGKPIVKGMAWKTGADRDYLSKLIHSIEAQSEHPLANALINYFQHIKFEGFSLEVYENLTGEGAFAIHEGKSYFIGSLKLMHANDISIADHLMQKADEWHYRANTVIWFANKEEALAVIALEDKINTSCAEVIATLEKMDIDLYLLTGDHEITTRQICRQAGLIDYRAQISPLNKLNFINELHRQGKKTAIISKAPDTEADVSIFLKSGFTTTINLNSCSLLQIHKSIRLSKKTIGIIRQNLFLAFIYNIIGISVATGIMHEHTGMLLNPTWIGAAMALSSICIVANSFRLKYIKV